MMDRALPRPLALPWRRALLASYVVVNVILVTSSVRLGPWTQDWSLFTRLTPDDLYTVRHEGIPFAWSPLAGLGLIGVVQVGYWPWVAAHVASVFLLRSPLLIGLVLTSYAFWFDTAQGNTLTFALVAGVLAMRRSHLAGIVYLALVIVIPRPLVVPLAVWLLWKHPGLRMPFAIMFAAHAVIVLANGWAEPWMMTVLTYDGPAGIYKLSNLLGPLWIMAPFVGAWLGWKGYVGWAGLLVSPYLLPQYLMWPLLGASPSWRCSRSPCRCWSPSG